MKLIHFLPGIAWFFVVLVLICLPGSDIPSVSWLDGIFFDKWVHAGLFGLMVLLFCWPFSYSSFTAAERRKYFIKIVMAVSVWGLATEFIQKYFVTARDFDLLDWAADTVGAIIAFWIVQEKFREGR